jgi:hypothetical protein
VQQTWLLHADTFGPKSTGKILIGTFLLPRWVYCRGGRARRIRRWRAGTDNNPFCLLGRIAMAIRRTPLLVSHE